MVQKWSQDNCETLRRCFECTEWNTFIDASGGDINLLSNSVADYINFCVDNVVPQTAVKCFPNNTPWITRDIKNTLNMKKQWVT
jgi:hypothetical protein